MKCVRICLHIDEYGLRKFIYTYSIRVYSIVFDMAHPDFINENIFGTIHETRVSVYLTCGFVAMAVLLVDFMTPLGVANGVPYVVVVLLSLKSPEKRFTLLVASICTLLVGVGYLGSPPSDIPMYQVFANRLMAILVIWVTAILTLIQRNKVLELHQERLKRIQSIKEVEIREEKLKVLKATMRTVQDITGNFLNNLHCFKFEIETNKTLSPESVKKLDALIQDTSLRIDKLGNMDEVREKRMAGDMMGIDYEHSGKDADTISRKY